MTVATREVPAERVFNPWSTFAVAAIAQFMVVLDASIMNVALPSIQRALHFSQADLQWVVNIYVLMFGGFLLLGGRAGDLFGRRRMFIIGLIFFSAASFAGGLAQSSTWLVVCRGIQGLGGAIISPVSLAIVSSTFAEGPERNRAVGIFGSLAGAGGAAGVLLGGILTTDFGWQWVLFVNVPVGILAAVLATRFIPRDVLPDRREGFDLAGAVSITAGLVSLVYAVVKAPTDGWTSSTILGFFALAVVLIAAFVVIELRTAHPLVRLGIFRTRNLTVADTAGMLSGAAMFAMFFFVSLYVQVVLGHTALYSGVAFLPVAVCIIIAAGITSQLVTRFGYKYIMTIGLCLAAVGLFNLTRIRVDGTYFQDVFPSLVLLAFGLGATFVPLQIASVSGVKPREIGLASGLVNAFLQIGGAIGLAVLSTIATTQFNGSLAGFIAGSPTHRPTLHDVHSAMVSGYHNAFLAGTVLLIAGAILVLLLLPQGGYRGAETAANSEPAPAVAT